MTVQHRRVHLIGQFALPYPARMSPEDLRMLSEDMTWQEQPPRQDISAFMRDPRNGRRSPVPRFVSTGEIFDITVTRKTPQGRPYIVSVLPMATVSLNENGVW